MLANCPVAQATKEHAWQLSQADAHEHWLQRAREWFEDSPEPLAEAIDDHLDWNQHRALFALKDRILWAHAVGMPVEPEVDRQWQAEIWDVIAPALEKKADELRQAAEALQAEGAVV